MTAWEKVAILWAVCSFLAYGFSLGHYVSRYPWDSHLKATLILALLGPIGLLAVLGEGLNQNFRLRPLSKEERFNAYREKWPRAQWDKFK